MTPMWKKTTSWKGSKRYGSYYVAGDYCDVNVAGGPKVLMEERQQMANENPLKFVRHWERHGDKTLRSAQRVLEENNKKVESSYFVAMPSSFLYQCRLPWVAIENPERFVWFWGEGKALDIDRLADVSILKYLPVV